MSYRMEAGVLGDQNAVLLAALEQNQMISYNNSSAQFSFLDITHERSPDLNVIIKNLARQITYSGISRDKEKIVVQHITTFKKQRHNFLKNQFLYDTIKQYCAGDNSHKPVLKKAGKIIAVEILPSHIPMKSISPVTSEEVQELRYIAEEKVIERSARIKCHMYETGMQNTEWFPLSVGEEIVNKAKNIIGESFQAYNITANLYLDKIQAVWYACDQTRNVALSNMDWLEKRCSLLHLRARILERRILLAFYSEEPLQVEALEVLVDILKEKICELKTELKKLQSTIKQYNVLKGTEYDSTLNEYINVLRKLKEQKWTLNKISDN